MGLVKERKKRVRECEGEIESARESKRERDTLYKFSKLGSGLSLLSNTAVLRIVLKTVA